MKTKLFYTFKDLPEYYEYVKEHPDCCHFYEIIDGIQRLYMDIDGDSTLRDDAIEDLVVHIKSCYQTRVHVYSSHREERHSYHIVLADVAVYNHHECKARIKEMLSTYTDPHQVIPHIDMCVYRSHQHFRLLGASKLGVNNTKVPWRDTPNDLELSFIADYHHHCPLILPYLPDTKKDIGYYARQVVITRPPLPSYDDSSEEESI